MPLALPSPYSGTVTATILPGCAQVDITPTWEWDIQSVRTHIPSMSYPRLDVVGLRGVKILVKADIFLK
jgi:hypothetical protein